MKNDPGRQTMLGRGQVLSGRLLIFKKIKQKSQQVGWSSLVMERLALSVLLLITAGGQELPGLSPGPLQSKATSFLQDLI